MTKMTMGIGYEIYTEIDALYPGFTIRFVESIEKQRRYMKELVKILTNHRLTND